MKLAQDERFRAERQSFRLRFTCEDCALFDQVKARCAHGFPTEEHRAYRYDDPTAQVTFCKEFELA